MREWNQMLASFTDEMNKIAGNSTWQSSSSNLLAKPASVTTGPSSKMTMKAEVKPTNYSVVHSDQTEAAYGSSAGVKSVPPPPVRT